MFADLRAGEYRLKLATLPAFRFHKPARFGPVMFWSSCKEWQAAHALNTRWPRIELPSAASVGETAVDTPRATSIKAARRFMATSFVAHCSINRGSQMFIGDH